MTITKFVTFHYLKLHELSENWSPFPHPPKTTHNKSFVPLRCMCLAIQLTGITLIQSPLSCSYRDGFKYFLFLKHLEYFSWIHFQMNYNIYITYSVQIFVQSLLSAFGKNEHFRELF